MLEFGNEESCGINDWIDAGLENTYINKLGLGSFYVSLWSSTEHKGWFVWYAAQAKNGISTGNTTNTPSYRAGCFMSIK